MESKHTEERIGRLEAEFGLVRAEHERLLSAVENYYVRALGSVCHPMENAAVVSLSAIDDWCFAYTNCRLIESDDYLASVGIRCVPSDSPYVSFADASVLARKLWVYVSSFMNGGPDFLFYRVKVYLPRASQERLRDERWIERRQRVLEQLLDLEEQFIALAHLNASLPANAADVHLAVFEELLLDADEKFTYDVEHLDGMVQEIELLTTLMKREVDESVHAILGFDRSVLAAAIAGNSFIDVEFVDLSPLENLGISV